MTLLSIVLVLALVGFVSWLVLQIPMAANMQKIIVGVVIFFVILWLLQEVGAIHGTYLKLK